MQFMRRIYLKYSDHEILFYCLPSAGPHLSPSRTGHTDVTLGSDTGRRVGAIHFMSIPCHTLFFPKGAFFWRSREWLCLDVTWLTHAKAKRVPRLVSAAAQWPPLRPSAVFAELNRFSSRTVCRSSQADGTSRCGLRTRASQSLIFSYKGSLLKM